MSNLIVTFWSHPGKEQDKEKKKVREGKREREKEKKRRREREGEKSIVSKLIGTLWLQPGLMRCC